MDIVKILGAIAEALNDFEGNDTLDVDSCQIVENELLVNNFNGQQFAIKVEAL